MSSKLPFHPAGHKNPREKGFWWGEERVPFSYSTFTTGLKKTDLHYFLFTFFCFVLFYNIWTFLESINNVVKHTWEGNGEKRWCYSPCKERNGIDLSAGMSMKEGGGDTSLAKSEKMGWAFVCQWHSLVGNFVTYRETLLLSWFKSVKAKKPQDQYFSLFQIYQE